MAASLLLHGIGDDGSTTLVDSSPGAATFTAFGNAKISTAESKFGGSSIALDGNGDYFSASGSSALAFGAGDFTVEFFAKKSANGVNGYDAPICTYAGTAGASGWWIELSASRGFFFAGGVGTPSITYSVNPNDGVWRHWAVCRSASTLRLFRDGAQVASKSDTTSYPQSGLFIGKDGYNDYFNGYIDELRVTKGEALYTADFTPPSVPFDATYALSGSVRDAAGALAARKVVAYREDTNAFVGAATSDATTGAYSLEAEVGTAHTLVFYPAPGEGLNALVRGGVLPLTTET